MTIKLLSIGHSYVVGVNRRLVNEMAKISNGKWEVHAIAPSKLNNDFRYFEYQIEPTDRCQISPLPVYCDRPIHLMLYDWRIADILQHGSWDIVHCWEEPYIVSGAQIAYLTPKTAKLVYYSPQNIYKQYPFPFGWFENIALNRMSGLIGVGTTATQTWSQKLDRKGIDKPLATIPHGVDLDLFKPNPSAKSAVLMRCGWEDNSIPIVGYLGRFTPEKGITMMMQMFERLSMAGVEWRWLVVGKGPMEGQLQQWATSYPDRVRILNDVSHESVPDYLNAMDMLLAPSQTRPNWCEQLGRMLIEAMACGVPVIASDSGEIPYVVGDAGIIAGENNLDEWVKAIQTLIDSPHLRKQLIQSGRERVEHLFSWSVVARQKIDFFESLL
jgi:glycosyltransferase involved in cell wall biosynthesis